MEKGTATKTKKVTTKEAFQKAFIERILTEGKVPASIFLFAKDLKSTEGEFYEHFNSFKALERSIWTTWFEQTQHNIEHDEAYVDYTVREKILAFYYTWIELLKNNRSFAMHSFDKLGKRDTQPSYLSGVRTHFDVFINDLMMEGKDTTEVAERPFSSQYSKVFWMHFLFICKFWSNDESSDFEKTDAAIEKSVNLAFDLIGKGALDSFLDFGKFIFQNRPIFG